MNVNLGEYYQAIIGKAIQKGLAGNQTEVIRQALLDYGRKLDDEEKMLVERAVRGELEKMKGKKWTTHAQLKKELGF
ncbi:MAG: type II toxin-antitoxin system ParD family antitoxin [Candidatus Micrarchaeia archaeon]|jgi:Arc/MetJ-type ribon-helix-helix transcriptional regulator